MDIVIQSAQFYVGAERINHGKSAVSFLGDGGGVDAIVSGRFRVCGDVTYQKAWLPYVWYHVCCAGSGRDRHKPLVKK